MANMMSLDEIGSSEYCSADTTLFPVEHLQGESSDFRENPVSVSGRTFKGSLAWIKGGTLLKDERLKGQFAFVMDRWWGDLRKLIDIRMQRNKNQGPPFNNDQILDLMRDIAWDMESLHSGHSMILHRYTYWNIKWSDFNKSNFEWYGWKHRWEEWEELMEIVNKWKDVRNRLIDRSKQLEQWEECDTKAKKWEELAIVKKRWKDLKCKHGEQQEEMKERARWKERENGWNFQNRESLMKWNKFLNLMNYEYLH